MINLFPKKNNFLNEKESLRKKIIRFGKIYLKIAIVMYILLFSYSIIAKYTEVDTQIFNYVFPENEKDIEEIGKYLIKYFNQTQNKTIKNITFIKNLSTNRGKKKSRAGKMIFSYENNNVISEIRVEWEYNGEYRITNYEIIE